MNRTLTRTIIIKKIKIAAIRIKNSSNKGTVASIMGFLMMGNGRVWFCKST